MKNKDKEINTIEIEKEISAFNKNEKKSYNSNFDELKNNIKNKLGEEKSCKSYKKKERDSFFIQDFEEAILEAFKQFDKDNSEYITKDELGNFVKSLGYVMSEIELESLISEVDEDGNGMIGLKEFRSIIMKSIRDDFTLDTSMEAFALFDKYRTQKINNNVLRAILLTKSNETNFSEEEVNDLFAILPKDPNGEMNYKDIIKSAFDIFNSNT